MLKQKARHVWIAERDFNSKFFHRVMKRRFQRNSLLGIESGNHWVDHVEDVKIEVNNHFKARFPEVDYSTPILSRVLSNHVSNEDKVSLKIPFSLDDLKEVIWSCDGDRIAGPDGFNMVFLSLLEFYTRRTSLACE